MKLSELKNIKFNEPMSRHTTFRAGGAADMFIEPESEGELLAALSAAKEENCPVTVIGNGSNILVRDGGVRGLVIHIGNKMSKINVSGSVICAEAGANMSKIAAAALGEELGGFEFASGIPGSIGGGLYMNAGAYGGELKDVVLSARYIKDGHIAEIEKEDMQLGYRRSIFSQTGGIITSVCIRLEKSSRKAICAKMNDYKKRRTDKQPLEFASAGSTFKRPEGNFAGALIEQAGLKGYSVGAAQVSEKHAGFIINRGGATSGDILRLIEYVQKKVFETSGVMLEPEVRIIGED